MKQITVPATAEQLDYVVGFVDEMLQLCDCNEAVRMKITLAVEEIYINIVHYAYHPQIGEATVQCTVLQDPLRITITFLDNGEPYNPLEREDPDVTLSIDLRPVGGLGVFMVKKLMDDVAYEYKNGTNILTIQKHL